MPALPSPNQSTGNLALPNCRPVILAGPLDQYGAETLKAQALAVLEGDGDAILEFGNIDRLHAASLQVLVALEKDLALRGRQVVLKSVDPAVRKLMRISGTEHFFIFLDGSD